MKWNALEIKLLSHPGAYKDFPFGEDVAVFKVVNKMFALVAWKQNPLRITLKCDPERAHAFRSMFDAVKPGYHMNKDHWNTIVLNGSIPTAVLEEMIDISYSLVVKSLRKSDRDKIQKPHKGINPTNK